MKITCVHCAQEIEAAASVCPWCHQQPYGNWSTAPISQKIAIVGNYVRILAVLTMLGIGIYLISTLF